MRIGKYINKQNNLIDEAKMQGLDCCVMIDVKPSIREQLEYYYTKMIGYNIIDGCIYFRHINFEFSKSAGLNKW